MVLAMVREAARDMEEEATRRLLEEAYESFDRPGLRVELLDGRLVVSPTPIKLHNRIVTWPAAALLGLCAERSWDLLTHGAVELATSGKGQPDLFVCPVDEETDGAWLIPAGDVLLAVEVVSPSNGGDEHEIKQDGYARSDVPAYLVIDPWDAKLTLHAGPGPDGYRRMTVVPVGDKLELPEPFGITLDTGTMPGRPASTGG